MGECGLGFWVCCVKPLFGNEDNDNDVAGGDRSSTSIGRKSYANMCALDMLKFLLHPLQPCVLSSSTSHKLHALTPTFMIQVRHP